MAMKARKDRSTVKGETYLLRLTKAELLRIKSAAAQVNIPMSDLMRDSTMAACERIERQLHLPLDGRKQA